VAHPSVAGIGVTTCSNGLRPGGIRNRCRWLGLDRLRLGFGLVHRDFPPILTGNRHRRLRALGVPGLPEPTEAFNPVDDAPLQELPLAVGLQGQLDRSFAVLGLVEDQILGSVQLDPRPAVGAQAASALLPSLGTCAHLVPRAGSSTLPMSTVNWARVGRSPSKSSIW
jgi:hypothetical protein